VSSAPVRESPAPAEEKVTAPVRENSTWPVAARLVRTRSPAIDTSPSATVAVTSSAVSTRSRPVWLSEAEAIASVATSPPWVTLSVRFVTARVRVPESGSPVTVYVAERVVLPDTRHPPLARSTAIVPVTLALPLQVAPDGSKVAVTARPLRVTPGASARVVSLSVPLSFPTIQATTPCSGLPVV